PDAVADGRIGPQTERGPDGREGARLERVLGADGADVGDRPAGEVAEVLAQRVQVEVGVAAGAVVLGVPVAGEDPAVHVAQHRAARCRLDLVLERVRELVALRAHGQVARRVEHGHGVAGPHLADGAGRALTGREHPARGAVAGGDRGPQLLGGPGQFDLTPDLELAAHGASFRLMCVRLGCRATTSRWRRPLRAPSVWYRAASDETAPARSSANAALSAADANAMSRSLVNGASGLPARSAPAISSPSSRTSRAPTASIQAADSWSGARAGSGSSGDSAAGEIT